MNIRAAYFEFESNEPNVFTFTKKIKHFKKNKEATPFFNSKWNKAKNENSSSVLRISELNNTPEGTPIRMMLERISFIISKCLERRWKKLAVL